MKRYAEEREKTAIRVKKYRRGESETVPKRRRNTPSSSSPSGNPPNPPPGGVPVEPAGGEEQTIAALEVAVADVAGTRSASTRTAAEWLAAFDPPFTPAEVAEFGRRWPELMPAEAKLRQRPQTGQIKNNIGLVRSVKPRRQAAKAAKETLPEMTPQRLAENHKLFQSRGLAP